MRHRIRRTGFSIWLAALAIGIGAPAGAVTDSRVEFWRNEERGWLIEARECGQALCGFLIGYKMVDPHPPGYVPTDENNPDAARRTTPICGLQVIGGFKPSTHKDGDWDGGWVYNPNNGKTYDGAISRVDADTVKLRAYVGIPLIGRTLVLHRVKDAPQRCAASTQNP
jgi:uncharacterized protein (DUF2147 family)